jgi:cell wall-associated NlpC family hydrolase
MVRRLCAILGGLALVPGVAHAADSVIQVTAPDGRVTGHLASGLLAPGSLSYAGDPSVVSVGAVGSGPGTVVLDDVSLLGGSIRATRVVVPLRGFTGGAVVGLSVEGVLVPVADANTLIPFGRSGYVIALQEAIAPSAHGQALGFVGLRVVLGQASGALPAGSQILVGLPAASATVGPIRKPSSPNWTILGLAGPPVSRGLLPVPEPPALEPLQSLRPLAADRGLATGRAAVAIAEQYLGIRYVWGGASPSTGFDCSGLAMFVYRQLGISLTHFTGTQWNEGLLVAPSDLQPGDLVFFDPGPLGPMHEGIYIGGGQFLQAPHTGDVVKISSLGDPSYSTRYVGAVRPY